MPSPILPDGRLWSIPIPERGEHPRPRRYADLRFGEPGLARVLAGLSRGVVRATDRVHLDPDLRRDAVARPAGWRPAAGQAAAAETHLRRMSVGAGDLFLFFGWFRRVHETPAGWRYMPGAPDVHVLFGWLQIDERIPVPGGAAPDWLREHPHWKRKAYDAADAIYTSTPRLTLGGRVRRSAGAGVFERYHDDLRLTAPDRSRSWWRLPAWIHPKGRRSALSYHGSAVRWGVEGGHTLLRTVGRGQEFVLDCGDYPEAVEWAGELVERVA
jgi:hypothetical protein